MAEVEKNNTGSSDEIDLKELFQAIGNFFKSIFINIMLFFVSIRNATLKNIKLIIICGVLGGLAGIALNYVSQDYYKSSMVLKSSYLSGRLMESAIDKLDALSDEDNYQQLANTLKIDLELARKIRGFSYEPFVSEDEVVQLEVFKEQLRAQIDDEETIEKFIDKLRSENRNTYRIMVEVFDNSIIEKLEQPLLNYFQKNPYVSKRLEIERTNLLLEEKNTKEELAKLDSLKQLIFKNFNYMASRTKGGSNNVILSDEQMTNPIDVFNASRRQYEDLLRINRSLYIQDSFELVDGFTTYAKPESPGLLRWGFFSGLVGLGVGYIIIILIAFNRYLTKVEQENRAA